MRMPVIISVLLLMGWIQLHDSIIVANYWLNYDYYSTVLCKNQDKPEMNCHGKCHLSEQMQEQDDQENPFEHATFIEEPLLYFNDLALTLEIPDIPGEREVKTPYSFALSEVTRSTPTEPPRFVL